jgi:hypothetical protein
VRRKKGRGEEKEQEREEKKKEGNRNLKNFPKLEIYEDK